MCAVAMPGDLDSLVLIFQDEESPTAGTTRACGLHLQVLLQKAGTSVSRLCGNQTAFFVSRRNRREADEGCFSVLLVCHFDGG